MKKTLSWLIVLAMVFAMIPAVFAAEESEVTYTKISSMEELTDGNYVIVCNENSRAMTYINSASSPWIEAADASIEGDTVTNVEGMVWSITVDGSSVKLCDANGNYVAPKGGNNNGIKNAEYSWAVSCEDGLFQFKGTGSDTVTMAYNAGDQANGLRFRAYKNTTVTGNNAASYPTEFALYKEVEVSNEEPEIPVEPETPVIPEIPEGGLILGDNTFNMAAGEASIELTYTATEAGTVTVEFTKMGYMGSLGMTDKPVAECFAGANDTTPWFNAYIDDVQLNALYKGAVEVEAGQTITIKVDHVGGTYFINKDREGIVNIGFVAGSSEGGDDVVEPIEGEIWNVETTDNNCYLDGYTFTAAVSGTYTFHIPAGLGLTTPERDENWQPAIIDYYDNANGYTHVIDLYAGQEYEVLIGSVEKTQWEIIWTVEEKEVEGPTEPDVPVVPPVVEGETVIIGTNAGKVDTMYIFTATEAGTLKIDATTGNSTAGALQGSYYNSGWLTLEVDGVAVDGLLQGVYTMEVAAGQVVSIQVKAGWQMFATATPNIILSMEAASEGGEEGGLILGENNIEGDIEYTYTADAEGTLTINGVGGKVEVGTFGAQNISAYYYQNSSLLLIVNGETIDAANAGVAEIGLKAGDSVTIKIGYGKDTFKNAAVVLTLSFVEGSIGGDEGGEEGGLILGGNNIEGDIEYTYTADAEGTLTINGVGGKVEVGTFGAQNISAYYYQNSSLLLIVNGETIDAANAGVAEIGLKAGDSVTIKIGYGKDTFKNAAVVLTLSFVEGSIGGDEGGDVEEPETNGTGTEADPFIIGSLPYEATQESGDDFYYQYSATEAGTVYVYYTNGLVSVSSSNGDNSWQSVEGGKSIEVAAGDVVTINPWNGNTGIKVEFAGKVDEPEGPVVGSGDGTAGNPFIIAVPSEHEQDAGDDLYYQFTAEKDGKILFFYNAGVFGVSGSSVGSWESMEGGKYMQVAAGDVITINAWNGCTSFSVAYEEESEEFNGILLEGNTVELKRGGASLYAWTASADGKFIVEIKSSTFSYGYTLTVNGQSMGYGTNELILDVKAGDLIIVEFTTSAAASTDWVLTLSGEMDDGTCRHEYVDGVCIKCGEAKEPDGTQDYPFIIGDQNETYAYESTPAWFQFTAEADTTLIIKTNKTKWHMLANVSIDGASVSPTRVTDGNYYVYTIEVKAGSVLKFRVNATTSSADEMIVEVQQQVACQHGNTRVEGAVEADCGNAGHTGKTVCADCGEEISAGEVIPATGEHNFIEGSCGICGEADPDYVPECEHNYVDGVCTNCGEADPDYVPEQPDEPSNPGTGSMNILAIALIAMMSATAVVVTAKKSDEE